MSGAADVAAWDVEPVTEESPAEMTSTTDLPTLKVALLGCGVVGSSVARVLVANADDLASRVGARLDLIGIAVRRPDRPRPDVPVDAGIFTADADTLVRSADVVIEVIGGIDPARIEGQKTAAFEIVDALGDAPDIHILPVGNAGNITAYWRGYSEYASEFEGLSAVSTRTPQMWGFQAAGAAPIVLGHPVDDPETIATAIRIGNPASWRQAEEARDQSGGRIESVTDEQILAAHRLLSSTEGIFVEPGSAASIAGLVQASERGQVPADATIVCTVTGHGLKDPQWALRTADGSEIEPVKVSAEAQAVAEVLGLES